MQPRTTRDEQLPEQEIRVTAYGTWVSHSGATRISLAIVLLAVAGALTNAGTRLPLPARPRRPGKAASVFMLVTWVLAIATFLVCTAVYVRAVQKAHLIGTPPADPITPVTLTAVLATFALINEMGQCPWVGALRWAAP